MTNSNPIPFNWLLNEKYRILYHVLFWLIMYLDEFLSLLGITDAYESNTHILFELLSDLALVYFNLYVLIPYFLQKGKISIYILLTLVSLILNAFVAYNLYYYVPEGEESWLSEYFIGTIQTTATLLGTAVAFNIFKRYIRNQQRLKQTETSKLNTELSFLKDQINPHFLFNALNNIYVQSKVHPKEAPETILQLSDLLRYQLYECSKDRVYLTDEIEYIKNYLALNKIRNQHADIQFEIKGDPSGKLVAPLIFLPFVENAVKYGIDPENGGNIFIQIDVEQNSVLSFTIRNNKIPLLEKTDSVGGIGLTNVKRRLDLIYPKQHGLMIKNSDQTFEIDLSLNL